MNNKNRLSTMTWGLLLPGCMFIGIGLGMAFADVKTGLFLGMGTGFLLAGILYSGLKKTNQE